jgi:hypothetical protein
VHRTGPQGEGREELGFFREPMDVGLGSNSEHFQQRGVGIDKISNAVDGVRHGRAITPLQRGKRKVAMKVSLTRPVFVGSAGGVASLRGDLGELDVTDSGADPLFMQNPHTGVEQQPSGTLIQTHVTQR